MKHVMLSYVYENEWLLLRCFSVSGPRKTCWMWRNICVLGSFPADLDRKTRGPDALDWWRWAAGAVSVPDVGACQLQKSFPSRHCGCSLREAAARVSLIRHGIPGRLAHSFTSTKTAELHITRTLLNTSRNRYLLLNLNQRNGYS